MEKNYVWQNKHQPSTSRYITGALNQFMGNAFLEELKRTVINATPTALKEVANGVVHPVTKETITKYKKLIEDPLLRETWSKAMCKNSEDCAKVLARQRGPTQ